MKTQCGASPPRSSADDIVASGDAVSAGLGLDTTAIAFASGRAPRAIGGCGDDAAAAAAAAAGSLVISLTS